MRSPRFPQTPARSGFSLTEVVIALGVLSFVIVGIIGLFALAIRTGNESGETTAATNVATLLLNQRRIAPIDGPGHSLSKLANFALPAVGTSAANFDPSTGKIVTPVYVAENGYATAAARAQFGLCYQIQNRGDVADVYLLLYWPPQSAGVETAEGKYEIATQIRLP